LGRTSSFSGQDGLDSQDGIFVHWFCMVGWGPRYSFTMPGHGHVVWWRLKVNWLIAPK